MKRAGGNPEKKGDELGGYRPDFVRAAYKGPERRPGKKKTNLEELDGKIRLNRYISHAGS